MLYSNKKLLLSRDPSCSVVNVVSTDRVGVITVSVAAAGYKKPQKKQKKNFVASFTHSSEFFRNFLEVLLQILPKFAC